MITWNSKKQATVALSTSETKYIICVWLALRQEQKEAMETFCDDKEPTCCSGTKHMDICYHFICDLVAKGKLVVRYCSTQEQIGDIIVKSL